MNRGVTLIELLVVVAIITVLASVIVIGQGAFNKTVLLTNTAYDVALTIRSAQTFGLSNRTESLVLNNTGYGIHFAKSANASFLLFADSDTVFDNCHTSSSGIGNTAPDYIPGDCVYNSSTENNAFAQTYKLGNGITFTNICASQNGTSYTCNLDSLDIVFARPNTKALITTNGQGYNQAQPYISAYVVLAAPQGVYNKYVCMRQTGEIHISASADDC